MCAPFLVHGWLPIRANPKSSEHALFAMDLKRFENVWHFYFSLLCDYKMWFCIGIDDLQ